MRLSEYRVAILSGLDREREGCIGIASQNHPHFLKQTLLLVDKIGLLNAEDAVRTCRSMAEHSRKLGFEASALELEGVAGDVEFLSSRGVILDFRTRDIFDGFERIVDASYQMPEMHAVLHMLEEQKKEAARYRELGAPKTREDFERRIKSAALGLNLEYEFRSRILTLQLRKEGQDALVLKSNFTDRLLTQLSKLEAGGPEDEEILRRPNLLLLVLRKLPMPDDTTPLERILDFKSDPDAQGYLKGLRVWMAELANQKLGQREAEDKLEWLLFQHTSISSCIVCSTNMALLGGRSCVQLRRWRIW